MNLFLSSVFYGTLKVSSITFPLINNTVFEGLFDCDAPSVFKENAVFEKKILMNSGGANRDILQEIDTKADNGDVQLSLNSKANITDVNDALNLKADTSFVQSEIAHIWGAGIAFKANDNEVVKLEGNQTVNGTKTFSGDIQVNNRVIVPAVRSRRIEIDPLNFITSNTLTLPGNHSTIFWDLRGQTTVTDVTINVNSLGTNTDRTGMLITIYILRGYDSTGNLSFTINASPSVSMVHQSGSTATFSQSTVQILANSTRRVRMMQFLYITSTSVLRFSPIFNESD